MGRGGEGLQQADGDRLNLGCISSSGGAADGGLVERHQHLAIGCGALRHLEHAAVQHPAY